VRPILTFLKAVGRAVAFRFRRGPVVLPHDHLVVVTRREVCGRCPHRRQLTMMGETADFCGICSCLIPAKTLLLTERCPDRRW
jgi:hypothetical protein